MKIFSKVKSPIIKYFFLTIFFISLFFSLKTGVDAETLGICSKPNGERGYVPVGQMTEASCKALDPKNKWDPIITNAEGDTTGVKKSDNSTGTGLFDIGRYISAFFGWIATAVLYIMSWFTWLAGNILNTSIDHTVVKMKANLGKNNAIEDAWRTIRDIGNMGFIFVLLYAGIQTILGVGKNARDLIVKIVVVAVLINFSLFFTKFVIDISNVLAIQFYEAIAPGAIQESVNGGLSNSLTDLLGFQSLYNASSGVNGYALLVAGVMGSVVMLIAAFIFLAIAILLVIRFVILVFVLVLSPIAFLSYVLPDMDKYRNQWKDALIAQAFFAPIYFAMTWVVISIARGVLPTPGGSLGSTITAAAGSASPNLGGVEAFINYAIVTTMLVVSLVVSKDWASKTPGGVGKLTNWATGMAGKATFGMAGKLGRGTIGRVGQQVADSEWLKDKAPNSYAARLALATGRKTAGASFDMRNAGIASFLDSGKGQKGGYAKDLKDKIKAEKDYADQFKPSDLTLARAEKELADIKKNGTAAQIAEVQTRVDQLKGVSEDEARKRAAQDLINQGLASNEKEAKKIVKEKEGRRLGAITRLTLDNPAMTRREAEEEIDRRIANGELDGLKIESIKGAANRRKEEYAKNQESGSTTVGVGKYSFTVPHFDVTGRVMAVGAIKKERLAIANEIRKSTIEKKSADKIVEEIQNQAMEAAEEIEPATPTPPPTTPTTP